MEVIIICNIKSMCLYIKITSFETKCIEGIFTVNLEQNKHFLLARVLYICAAVRMPAECLQQQTLSMAILDVKVKSVFSLQVILFYGFFFLRVISCSLLINCSWMSMHI